jgi:hypothetical protein
VPAYMRSLSAKCLQKGVSQVPPTPFDMQVRVVLDELPTSRSATTTAYRAAFQPDGPRDHLALFWNRRRR